MPAKKCVRGSHTLHTRRYVHMYHTYLLERYIEEDYLKRALRLSAESKVIDLLFQELKVCSLTIMPTTRNFFLTTASLLALGISLFAVVTDAFAPLNTLQHQLPRSSVSLSAQQKLSRENVSGSDLFPQKGPYVPSGLSSDEYEKIKQEEEAKLKKMNFGTWGPRFKQTDRPDGDWMVMPRLWTSGFNSNDPSRMDPSGENVSRRRQNLLTRLGGILKENRAGFVMAFILIHSLMAAVSMWKSKEAALQKFLLSTVVSGTMRLRIAALSLSTLLTPLSNKILEKVNRSKLWSPRRTVSTILGSTIALLSMWAVVLRVII